MALDALGDDPVNVVTGGAGEIGMLALVFLQLLDLLGMAGQASIGDGV